QVTVQHSGEGRVQWVLWNGDKESVVESLVLVAEKQLFRSNTQKQISVSVSDGASRVKDESTYVHDEFDCLASAVGEENRVGVRSITITALQELCNLTTDSRNTLRLAV